MFKKVCVKAGALYRLIFHFARCPFFFLEEYITQPDDVY